MFDAGPKFLRQFLNQIKSGDWLIRRRVIAYSVILLGFELAAFLFLYAGVNGWIVAMRQPVSTDFVSFYAAGHLADVGAPAGAYVRAAHYAAEQQAVAPGIPYMVYFYPPVFTMLCALLARLPYTAAFMLFESGSLLAWLAVMKRILGRVFADERMLLVPVLAFPAVLINFGVGQNGFITAALLGGATLLVDRRPALAGVLFGAMCYKPHFGLLVPVALLAGRRWRTIVAAGITVTCLIGASAAWFGIDTWQVFLSAFRGSHSVYESGRVDFAAIVSPFGTLRLLGMGTAGAYWVQGLASLVAIGLVAWVWGRDLSLPTRAAMLAAATVVAVPLTLYYDLLIAGVAMAWLVGDGARRGFLSWEKSALVGIFVMPVVVREFDHALHLPLGVLGTVGLVAIVVAHARRELAARNISPKAGAELLTQPA